MYLILYLIIREAIAIKRHWKTEGHQICSKYSTLGANITYEVLMPDSIVWMMCIIQEAKQRQTAEATSV